MVDGGLNGERLSEVSRLAGVLADQVLHEPMDGQTSLAKLTALGKAALLLQDYDRPIPDRVVDVLSRALRGTEADGAEAGETHEAGAVVDAEEESREAGAIQVADDETPRRLFPRLIQSLRVPRG